MKIKDLLFKDRTIGFYIGLGAAVLAFVMAIVYLSLGWFAGVVFTNTHPLEQTFLVCAIIFFFLGAASQVLNIWKDYKFSTLIPVVFYSIALAMHLYLTCFPLADVITGIAFFGGSAPLAIMFAVIFGLCAIGAIISCFMDQRKTQAETE